MAKKAKEKFGIPWEAIVAQAAWETGWLKYPTKDIKTRKDSRNLFNIKADSSWTGEVVNVRTWEVVGGKRVTTTARFRAYATYAESMADYCYFILRNPRYKKALAHFADPVRYIREVAAAGYATDPKYADGICSIMKRRLGVR